MFNPTLLAFVTDQVKQASAAPAINDETVKQAAFEQALMNNAYWDEMSKQAAVAEDAAAEQAFNTVFADEFTKLAADFAAQYNYVPQSVAAFFE